MSRFTEYDDWDDNAQWAYIRWQGRCASVMRGRPAQRYFRELIEALDVMPVKRLIASDLCRVEFNPDDSERFEVCAVGQMIVHRRVAAGEDREAVLRSMATLEGEGSDETARQAQAHLGMTYTLGWLIAEANDETFSESSTTPEQRWERMRAWATEHIRAEVTA